MSEQISSNLPVGQRHVDRTARSPLSNCPGRILGTLSICLGLLPIIGVGIYIQNYKDPYVALLVMFLLAGLAACMVFGLLCGFAAYACATGAQDEAGKRLAIVGVLAVLAWPLIVAGEYLRQSWEHHQQQQAYIETVKVSFAKHANVWRQQLLTDGISPEKFYPDADGIYENPYCLPSLKLSPQLAKVAPHLIAFASDDFFEGRYRGPRGRVIAFADGHVEYVSREKLESVIEDDDQSRAQLGLTSDRDTFINARTP